MRKIIVSMNITLDGFISGPNGELDWHFKSWDEEMGACLGEQLSYADTILMGRVTYGVMSSYWPSVTLDSSYPRDDIAFADMMNNYTKIVFSKTLKHTGWCNSILINGSAKKEILKLKNEPGKSMMVYGSGTLVAALMKMNVINEFILWVHPVTISRGKPLFKKMPDGQLLRLLNTKQFKSGVAVLHYEVLI